MPHKSGVYRCEITKYDRTSIADPCFGETEGLVMCEIPNGVLALVKILGPSHPRTYHPSLSEVGRVYPWRLKLANGLVCSWNWLNWQGHDGGGWICVKVVVPPTKDMVGFAPAWNQQLLTGRAALHYNGGEIIDTSAIYYAERLDQGSQSTWSVLLESPGNFGVFTRVDVAQAWY